jgi:Flp pilus assembly protein TadG
LILALGAFLLLVILAMAAFAVDIGYICSVQSQLQSAADSAALAGATQLMNPYVQYYYPTQSSSNQSQILSSAMASGTAQAQRFASLNAAGDVTSLALPNADVVFGFLDSNKNFSPAPPDPRFPNSVQVTVRRDTNANQPLNLIFGPAIGKSTVSMTATARGTIMAGPNNFRNNKGVNANLLPVGLDVRVWNQFASNGTSPSANNQVLIGPNGQPELQVYPDSSQFGSFGLVSIGAPANDVPSYRTWIDNGATSNDLQYLKDHGQLPVSGSQPGYWSPGPGMKSTLQSDFASIIGQPRLIPLYDGSLSSGNGYPIVGFAGVTISEATGGGSNMNISVQPVLVIDPTGYGGVPAGSISQPTFSFTPPALTQ